MRLPGHNYRRAAPLQEGRGNEAGAPPGSPEPNEAQDVADAGLEAVPPTGTPAGECVGAQGVFVFGGAASACRGEVGGSRHTLISGGGQMGLEGLTGQASIWFTNADEWGDLTGWSICSSGGGGHLGGGGSVSVCQSQGSPDIYMVILSGEAGFTEGATWSVSRSYGWLQPDPVGAAVNGVDTWWTDITEGFVKGVRGA